MVTPPIKTLLIEDREADRELLLAQLRSTNGLCFDVELASSLATGLEILSHGSINLIILDLNLPDSRGLETCQHVRALALDLPVIVLTCLEDQELGAQAAQLGAQDYLVKGRFDETLLLRSIQFALERKRRELAERTLLRNQAEMDIARQIQKRLLPKGPPSLPGFDIAGSCKPAAATGGDFYDYIPMADGSLGTVVADVSSHGFGPALIMAGTRRLLRTLVDTHSDIGEILSLANRAICEDTDHELFVTVFFARLDPRSRIVVYAGAGHCGFVIESSGRVLTLESTGLILGIADDIVVETGPPVQLCPGDLLLLITDGFFEAQNSNGTLFGLPQVLDLVRENRTRPAVEILKVLDETVQAFCHPVPVMDDQTAVIVRIET
jgi:phosphoserine phosphatase RsbU/P